MKKNKASDMVWRWMVVLMLFFAFSSCQKKESIPVTKENLRTVLTQYGKDHLESKVIIQTSFGTMTIRLYDKTPLHRANFVKLINEGYYDNANFYRIVYQFMIQGGDLQKKLDFTLPTEVNKKYFHKKGALAMAQFDENNPTLETSATEFYIVQGSKYPDWQVDEEAKNFGLTLTPEQKQTYMTLGGDMSLDGKYTVFGEVVEGLDIIDKIASVKVHDTDRPLAKIPLQIRVEK